jgi:hypothetical protein
MEQVILLTEEQTEQIKGRNLPSIHILYPRQDADNNWVVSITEQENCVHPDFDWIKKCPRIEYKPKPIEIPEIEIPTQE